MKFILFYHKDTSILGKNFKSSIIMNWPEVDTEICNTIYNLKQRMKQNSIFFEDEIYIILVDSKSRLMELIFYSYIMEDKSLILILADESKNNMKLAMYLYPRFTTGISENYEDLHLVLKQMIDNENRLGTSPIPC